MTSAKQNPRLLPTVRKRARFIANRRSPKTVLESCTLQGNIHPCEDENGLQAGFTVTTRTGNAVERNRIKRRLRHAVATAVSNAKAGMSGPEASICGEIILIARRPALSLSHEAMVTELTKGIDRLLSKSKKAATSSQRASRPANG